MSFTEKSLNVPWPGAKVPTIPVTLTSPGKDVTLSGYGIILGPGAGGNPDTLVLNTVAKELAMQGHFCARYVAKPPVLAFRVSLCARVMEYLFHPDSGQHPLKGCFLGGHSMGTRVAGTLANNMAAQESSSTASSTYPSHFVKGVVFMSYPIHTGGDLKNLRNEILLQLPPTLPTLFISGLKDSMCQPALFAKCFKDMKATPRKAIQVQGADHGLDFGKSKIVEGKKQSLADSIADWVVEFMDDGINADGADGAALASDKKSTKKSGSATTKAKGALPTGTGGGSVVLQTAELKPSTTKGEWTTSLSTVQQ